MSATTVQNTSTAGGGFYVTVVTPKGALTKKIEGDMLSVGRGEDCNLSIAHDTLSRRHLTVHLRDGQCWVEDHGSSNGTFINGKRIRAHASQRVLPEDYVQLGQSGVRLSVSAEPQMWKAVTPSIPGDKSLVPSDTIVTSTVTERRTQRNALATIEPKRGEEAQQHAENLMQEAQKRSAAIIQEAEVEAERRVQDIYRRAHETQAKMDEVFQRRMNEAYRAAEKMYQKSQGESEAILDEARKKSTEIRSQAEGFVMELRRRTEEDCERILEEAQSTARELKENRLAEAEEMIRQKETSLVNSTREAMNTRLARFEEDLLTEAARQRDLLESELADRRVQIDLDLKDQVEALKLLKQELQGLNSRREMDLEAQRQLEIALHEGRERAAKMNAEVEASKVAVADLTAIAANLRKEITQLTTAHDEGKAAVAKIREAQDGMDAELLRMRDRFEENKAGYHREEQKHLEELKLETNRKIQRLEQQLVQELSEKRERLTRELVLGIETQLKRAKDGSTPNLHKTLSDVFDAQISVLSKDPGAKEKQRSLVALKRTQKWLNVMGGMVVGAALMWGGWRVQTQLNQNQAPLQRRVIAAAEERKADLERRKFNPMQTKELKLTYAESVLYTEGFTERYLGDEFQKKLLAEVTPYMLKTWRLDEDKVIQMLAASTALVKELSERRENIHPDFIPQGIEKMKELENESSQRMRKLLGSQVRLESFRKFERKFYEGWPQ